MQTHWHEKTVYGRAFLWGGIALGLLLLVALLTHGFGLLSGSKAPAAESTAAIHQGGKIIIPDGSPLRQRIETKRVSEQVVNSKLALPGVVESEPSRTAAVLAPL